MLTLKRPDHNTPKRVLVKATSWEIFSTSLTAIISYPFTDNICSSIELALWCLIIKIVFYYYHDRLWHQISWGKVLTKVSNDE